MWAYTNAHDLCFSCPHVAAYRTDQKTICTLHEQAHTAWVQGSIC